VDFEPGRPMCEVRKADQPPYGYCPSLLPRLQPLLYRALACCARHELSPPCPAADSGMGAAQRTLLGAPPSVNHLDRGRLVPRGAWSDPSGAHARYTEHLSSHGQGLHGELLDRLKCLPWADQLRNSLESSVVAGPPYIRTNSHAAPPKAMLPGCDPFSADAVNVLAGSHRGSLP
jgi:hypothetical protein